MSLLGPEQFFVHADGEVSPLHKRRREGRARAHSPATVARPLRAGAAAIANATAGFDGSVELMEGGLVIRSLNSRAMPRKTSTSALAEETKIHFCIYPSPRRRPKHHDAIDAKVGFLQFARPAGPADARVGA